MMIENSDVPQQRLRASYVAVPNIVLERLNGRRRVSPCKYPRLGARNVDIIFISLLNVSAANRELTNRSRRICFLVRISGASA